MKQTNKTYEISNRKPGRQFFSKVVFICGFAVHSYSKSHKRATLTMGKGAIVSVLQKQKLNTKSSTEDKLVGADDASSLILWAKIFLESKVYKVEQNISTKIIKILS